MQLAGIDLAGKSGKDKELEHEVELGDQRVRSILLRMIG